MMHRLPRDVVQSLFLEVFKESGDMRPRDVVRRHDRSGLTVGLGGVSGVF